MFKIYVGSQLIYTFGYEDESLIGHTPGSVMVFADIPMNANGEKIRIISQSPYANYASYLTDIVVGDRDVAILYFVKAKMPMIFYGNQFLYSNLIFS